MNKYTGEILQRKSPVKCRDITISGDATRKSQMEKLEG